MHTWLSLPRLPQGQGLNESTSWNAAGNRTVDPARAIDTHPSSTGSRRPCSRLIPNSGASSRKRMPWWARDASPGRVSLPPPTIPSLEAE